MILLYRTSDILTRFEHILGSKIEEFSYSTAAPYPVRPARPWPYLDFEKWKAAAAAAASIGGLPGLGARAALVAPLQYIIQNGVIVKKIF